MIIGSGPAGLTAAVHAARAELAPLVVAGRQSGGQLILTSEVENYPGFPDGILGPGLMDRMREQAERFGAQFVDDAAIAVDFQGSPLVVTTEGERFAATAVIIATGASARWLGLSSEARLRGRGVSSCATCRGFFFRGRAVAVVGGGDTALEEAIVLTKGARSVTVIHRRNELRASKILQDRARNHPKIRFLWDSVVHEVRGDEQVTGVGIENVTTGSRSDPAVRGLFVAIGHTPNTDILRGQIEPDDRGYVRRLMDPAPASPESSWPATSTTRGIVRPLRPPGPAVARRWTRRPLSTKRLRFRPLEPCRRPKDYR